MHNKWMKSAFTCFCYTVHTSFYS